MGRGFVSGVFWGAIVSVMILWLASQLGGMITLLSAPPGDVSAVPPSASTQPGASADSSPSAPSAQSEPSTDPSRLQTPLAGSADSEKAPTTETAPAAQPQTEAQVSGPGQPAAGTAPQVAAPSDNATPAQGQASIAGPAAPAPDAAPKPAEAPPPRSQTSPVVAMPASPTLPPVDAEGRPTQLAETAPAAIPPNPAAPQADKAPGAAAPPPGTGETPLPQASLAAPGTESAPAAPGTSQAPNVPGAVVPPFTQPQVVQTPAPQPQPQPPAPQTAGEERDVPGSPETVTVLRPGDTGGLSGPDLKSRRLPTIGAEASQPAATSEPDAQEAPQNEQPALERYATSYEPEPGKALLSVLLFADGQGPGLEPLPFPVTYVVDARRRNAHQLMTAYRQAGFEVVAMTPLPEGAQPSDVAVILDAYLAAVPEVVALLDSRGAVFQSNRQVASAVASAAQDKGLGLITYSRGLNSAIQVAQHDHVPAALVFRELDADGQDVAAMKRYLDQAAFRAGQRQGVVLVAHNRPETITALTEWNLGSRASSVSIAPVSALLRKQR